MSIRAIGAVLFAIGVAGCDGPTYEPPDRAQRVAEADSLFALEPALFDTIRWASADERLTTGNEAYAVHCRKCHGTYGHGDTPYARNAGHDVPSLVEPDWEYAGDLQALRRRIFTGHPDGMPTWGIAGIAPREIDAVAHYILERLRPAAQAPARSSQ